MNDIIFLRQLVDATRQKIKDFDVSSKKVFHFNSLGILAQKEYNQARDNLLKQKDAVTIEIQEHGNDSIDYGSVMEYNLLSQIEYGCNDNSVVFTVDASDNIGKNSKGHVPLRWILNGNKDNEELINRNSTNGIFLHPHCDGVVPKELTKNLFNFDTPNLSKAPIEQGNQKYQYCPNNLNISDKYCIYYFLSLNGRLLANIRKHKNTEYS